MEVNTTTIPPERFHPYTPLEYAELKEIINTITTHIPTDKMSWVWNNYKRISGDKSNQPCSCGSAAKYWINATNTIREFVKKIEENV